MFAYLTVAPDAGSDGRLHAFEIAQLTLGDALVILSGCDTGTGRIAGGEGVLSLSRAFLRAGASATVATLWPIGSGSAGLIGEFYRQLANGVPPHEALRQAKLRALRGRFSHPLYWAPFVFVGS
jgi:CHAT domain-containing protein